MLVFFTIGMFLVAIILVSIVVFHQRRTIKYSRQIRELSEAKIKELQKELDDDFKRIIG